MEKKELPDLLMDGVHTAAGGRYNKVNINGVSKINGALEARTCKCDGVLKVNGDLTAEEIELNGNVSVKGSLHTGVMKLEGVLSGEGGLRGERCELDGMLKLKGSCELEELTGEGVFTIGGLLSAGRIDFGLHGRAEAGEIGVESLRIRKQGSSAWGRLLGGIIPKLKIELRAKVIEGDDLDLEYTSAEVVRGGKVSIGPGCNIGLVEYRTHLSVHPGAHVLKEEKTGE
ncbi:cell shape determination protein CcmA [Paenibacillus piscarius]|uniref:cell shape determination protein CcmA n=1 Tax=Paenibacillus piscarius TaxID=1089681 RepID=UPI001EE84EF3|nr:cell shape determination protein CcmA [Paenibacillus piscarius]